MTAHIRRAARALPPDCPVTYQERGPGQLPRETIDEQEDVMCAVLNDSGRSDTGQEPGAAMRVMAALLAERGFDVRGPEYADSRLLTITNARRARCEIEVADDEHITWEYIPWAGSGAGPGTMARMVAGILGAADTGPGERYKHLHQGATFKGAIARELQARGLAADLRVYENRPYFEVEVDVEITNPARPERGQVWAGDDGTILWECCCDDLTEGAAVVANITAAVLVRCRPVATVT